VHLKKAFRSSDAPCFAGSMLADTWKRKRPSTLWQVYLKITFDRVIVPTGMSRCRRKVIAAEGLQGGQAGRHQGQRAAQAGRRRMDIPAAVPWKVLMLPARGPAALTRSASMRIDGYLVVPRPRAGSHQHLPRPQRRIIHSTTSRLACPLPLMSPCLSPEALRRRSLSPARHPSWHDHSIKSNFQVALPQSGPGPFPFRCPASMLPRETRLRPNS